jgi:hypothetical protein
MLGLQVGLSSLRKYLNVMTNFCIFRKFNPDYEFNPDNTEYINDLVINLLILKEAWQPLFEVLRQEAFRERSILTQIVKNVIEQKEKLELTPEQEDFLSKYLGENSPFGDQRLSSWLAKYPTLA